jgi:Protein of unknown function (DUF3175)
MSKPATRGSKTKRKASKSAAARKAPARKWSAKVTRESDALDLEGRVFAKGKPADVARSLKRSAERSARRKSTVRPCRC